MWECGSVLSLRARRKTMDTSACPKEPRTVVPGSLGEQREALDSSVCRREQGSMVPGLSPCTARNIAFEHVPEGARECGSGPHPCAARNLACEHVSE